MLLRPFLHGHPPGKSIMLTAAALAGLSCAGNAATPLYLAFGVESTPSSALHNQIVINDLHVDHYHYFDINDGEEDSHVPTALTVVPGGDIATLTLGAMNVSPYPILQYALPSADPSRFELHLTSLSGPGGTSLIVDFMNGGNPATLLTGQSHTLSLTAVENVRFSLPSGAPTGSYEAQFRIVDSQGIYLVDSLGVASLPPGSPMRAFDSNFTILVSAVPEPSTAPMAVIGMAWLAGRRRSVGSLA